MTNDATLLELQEHGFVRIPEFINGIELERLQSNIEDFIESVRPKIPAERIFYEDKTQEGSLKQIQHMDEYADWAHSLFHSGELLGLAQKLLGGAVVPKNMQYFNKPPRLGRPTPAHQDGFYFMLDPCEALTMWLALEPVDLENGCVHYVRGSHRGGMREHCRTSTLGFSQGIADFPTQQDRQQSVAVHAEPGDLLVHDAMTIHYAGENRSEHRTRRALGFIYYSHRARVDGQRHAEYQSQLANDLRAQGKI
ncbi:MAG: phytanoyl-CoA dioxygenase family protein [Planctomycetota bacterium]